MAKLTQKQIDAAAAIWKDADDQHRISTGEFGDPNTTEYWAGKRYAAADTFAAIMGLDWATAADMLQKRSRALA